MKKFHLLALAASVFLAAAPVIEAEAKRLGGGGNMGRVAPSGGPAKTAPGTPAKPAQQPQTAPQGQTAQPAANAPAAAGQAARSSWMGPLAGIAAGLGLAALASYLGFGEELMSLMLIILAVVIGFAIFRMIMSRRQPAPAGAGGVGGSAGGYGSPNMARTNYGNTEARESQAQVQQGQAWSNGTATTPTPASGAAAGAGLAATQISAQEIESFLKVAREQFTHLQSIWDKGDIHLLADFCTPEMTRELSHQIADRRGSANHTQVVSLNADWIGMSDSADDFGKPVDEVMVRFSGLIRESEQGAAQDFNEIWTLQRAKDGKSGWQLAGITQVE